MLMQPTSSTQVQARIYMYMTLSITTVSDDCCAIIAQRDVTNVLVSKLCVLRHFSAAYTYTQLAPYTGCVCLYRL